MSYIFKRVYLREGLIIPRIVANLTKEQIDDISNGCGPASAKVDLIPDAIAGVDFTPACTIHDMMYHFGEDREDKEQADRTFLYNILTLVDEHCKESGIIDRMKRIVCRECAFSYYKAVSDWGLTAFWDGKDKTNHG